MKRNLLFFVVVFAVLFGCTDTIKGKSIAEPKIAVFHDQLNAGLYEQIFTEASDEFRNAAPKEKIMALFTAIETKLGKVTSSSITSWKVNTYNFSTIVMLVADTKFEHGNGTETFTYGVSGDKAKLVGYYINSLDMMTR
jgi:hypothetical protein